MSSLSENIKHFEQLLEGTSSKLVAVSKTKPASMLQEAYDLGIRIFGENKVQELTEKYELLPKDIEWHMIGHLQSNKVKYIAPFVSLIHGVDSFKLLKEINKRAVQNNRVISCLFQMHIAKEESKFGLSEEELMDMLQSEAFKNLSNVKMKGLMGMATYTENEDIIRNEFKSLKTLFEKVKSTFSADNLDFTEISMGMSGDFKIALEEGSTMIRVGSAIFGARN
ncbi:YggS family pyridoxal phosphate-dependent enzyme [Flexithrix dorotheae]|uniref:YggS family pyridoxal phosphate-dependent enzyme n=1 Tax=Flexithrix dorotheae TaxID=70993 RepID=UPI000367C358|nr:YggS family pyridoxal phosphate-dependent enzyme [Flexithrix dorotheae]